MVYKLYFDQMLHNPARCMVHTCDLSTQRLKQKGWRLEVGLG